jgi:hypothetical protein
MWQRNYKPITADRFTVASSPGQNAFWLRANEIEYVCRNEPSDETHTPRFTAVVNGPVRIKCATLSGLRLVAAGDVEIDAALSGSILIVSGGNVKLPPSAMVDQSLVFAKGKVQVGLVNFSRVVGGKSVTYNRRASVASIISEKDSSPLGYIRWEKSLEGGKKGSQGGDPAPK